MRFGAILAQGTFDDPENARIIYLAIGGLLLLAIVLSLGTWYWWRTSRVEHPALGPLEMMGTRSWRRSDFNNRARQLEESRPANAIHEAEPAEPDDDIDLDALGKAEPPKFDDFSDLLPAAAAADVAEAAADAPEAAAVETAAPADAAVAAEEPAPIEEPVVEVEEPAVEEPAPAAPGIIVIDTAPSSPAATQLTFDEVPAEPAADAAADDDGQHFDPLLRLHTSE